MRNCKVPQFVFDVMVCNQIVKSFLIKKESYVYGGILNCDCHSLFFNDGSIFFFRSQEMVLFADRVPFVNEH